MMEVRGQRSEVRRFLISNFEMWTLCSLPYAFQIRNPKSEIRNPKSPILSISSPGADPPTAFRLH